MSGLETQGKALSNMALGLGLNLDIQVTPFIACSGLWFVARPKRAVQKILVRNNGQREWALEGVEPGLMATMGA